MQPQHAARVVNSGSGLGFGFALTKKNGGLGSVSQPHSLGDVGAKDREDAALLEPLLGEATGAGLDHGCQLPEGDGAPRGPVDQGWGVGRGAIGGRELEHECRERGLSVRRGPRVLGGVGLDVRSSLPSHPTHRIQINTQLLINLWDADLGSQYNIMTHH